MTPNIQTQITLLQNTKDEIRTAIMEKGVTVYNNDPFSIYPTRIGQISSAAGDRDALFTDILERDITSIEIPEGTSRIDEAVFRYCTQMTTVVIPSTVSFIGYLAFEHCTALTSITCLATTPPTLGGGSFNDTNNCPIYVPAASVDAYKTAWPQYASRIVAIVDNSAFCSIVNRTVDGNLIIPSGATKIGWYAFMNCTDLDSVLIPSGVTTIQQRAFQYCSSLASANIPSGVTDIEQLAFYDTGITSITIPDSVTTIGDYAFEDCNNLTTVEIGTGITSIGSFAFGIYNSNYSSKLTSVTVKATTPPTMADYAFSNENDSTWASGLVIYVPSASVNTYKAASGWSTYASVIRAIPS